MTRIKTTAKCDSKYMKLHTLQPKVCGHQNYYMIVQELNMSFQKQGQ